MRRQISWRALRRALRARWAEGIRLPGGQRKPARVSRCDGDGLRRALEAAVANLAASVNEVNALNVFPVPDGDTGTNMLLTAQAALRETANLRERTAAAVAQAMARGALMGARGNSGVILSQILGGLAKGLAGHEDFGPAELATALQEAASSAYKAVQRPVEGTILTVVREVAAAAPAAANTSQDNLVAMLETLLERAAVAVAETPQLLPVLAEAGVVDAGGQGLYRILEGVLRLLRGEAIQAPRQAEARTVAAQAPALKSEWAAAEWAREYGYCTEFLLEGANLDLEAVRAKIAAMGDSSLVVGDGDLVHVHVHAEDPGVVLSYAAGLGSLHQIKVENMQEQRAHFLRERSAAPSVGTAVVAVASGQGLVEVLHSLGAAAVVPGGQTMNPSTEDLLSAVEAAAGDQVIVLPNNRNITATAGQVAALSRKVVRVVPTENVPQGVAALLALNYEADLDANVAAMWQAATAVRAAEVTRASRSVSLNGFTIEQGQVIGLLNGTLAAVGEECDAVVLGLLARMATEAGQVATLYYGDDVEPGQAEQLVRQAQDKFPDLTIELVQGGQPHYSYLISVE